MSGNDNTTVPSPTVTAAEAPTNSDATTSVPNHYEICDRTGFRVRPGTLVKEWNGLMVRPESYEARHPQDFVRSRSDKQTGSVRPEQSDRFISTLYPNGVDAATDL